MAKKKEIYFGKGFKRIYFVLAGLWIAIWIAWAFYGNIKDSHDVKMFFLNIALPFIVYFIILFFIKGFKK